MSLLLYGPVHPDAEAPDFGETFPLHMQQKTHPQLITASKSAWALLGKGLGMLGVNPLPPVVFMENGKPYFEDSPLHFSISHSGNMAAVLISDDPCGVDIEQIRDDVSSRMTERCLHEDERLLGCNFFEIWTKKECISKLDGKGMPSRPREMNTTDSKYDGCFSCMHVTDSDGGAYMLTALCTDAAELQIIRI